MSKLNWNRAIFFLLGAFFGQWVFGYLGRLVRKV
jgi:hypothetical protein